MRRARAIGPLVLRPRAGAAEQLRLEPWFKEVRDHVQRPDQVAPTTLYFWDRWAPRLGAEPVLLLLWMRARFSRTRADEERGEFQLPPQEDLAAATGLGGIKAVRAALEVLEAHGFVARRRHYRWDPARRQTVHMPDRYLVSIEDPVAPEDEQRVLELAAQRVAMVSPPRGDCVGRLGLHTPEVIHNRGGVKAPRAPTGPPECVGPAGRHTPRDNDLASVWAPRAYRDSNVEEESTQNVNVEAPTGKRLEAEALTIQLINELGDPGSRRFYEIVVAKLPHEYILAALSETREARRLGSVRRSAGAYFTDLIKRTALELGVQLHRPHA